MKTESCLQLQERNAECSGEAGKREDQCASVCAGALVFVYGCASVAVFACLSLSAGSIHMCEALDRREVKDKQPLDELGWKEMCRSSLSAASRQQPHVARENKSVRDETVNGRES